MKASKHAREQAVQLFEYCRVDGVLDEERAQHTLRQLEKIRPGEYLGILGHFRRLVQLYVDQHTAKLESAQPLSPDLRTRLQAELGRLYGPGLSFFYSETPALIGGMRIQVGSDVYDGTLRNRLNVLEQSF